MMWHEREDGTWVLKMWCLSHASLAAGEAASCPSIGVTSCATDRQYCTTPWEQSHLSDAMQRQMRSPCSHICMIYNTTSEAYNTTHLSPYCRSATPFGGLMLCLAQTTMPTPVASQPFFDFTSAMFTALWFEQLLFLTKLSMCKYIYRVTTYLLYIVLVIVQIRLESGIIHKVWPSLTETGIIFIVWDRMASQVKVGIKSDE